MRKIDIHVRPSRYYVAFLLATMWLSLMAITYTPCSVALKIVLAVVVILYGADLVWSHGLLRARHSLTGVRLLDNGGWWLHLSKP